LGLAFQHIPHEIQSSLLDIESCVQPCEHNALINRQPLAVLFELIVMFATHA
jgi:hypothetical protein